MNFEYVLSARNREMKYKVSFYLPHSTFYDVIKSKDSIKSQFFEVYINIKRSRYSGFSYIEKCFSEWIRQTFDKYSHKYYVMCKYECYGMVCSFIFKKKITLIKHKQTKIIITYTCVE